MATRVGKSTFDRPVGDRVERIAGAATARVGRRVRTHRQTWTPLIVSFVGFLAMAVVLIAVGEFLSRVGFLSGLRHWDARLSETLADHRTPGWDRFSEFGSKSAETVPIVLGGLLVEAVLAVRRRWRDMLLVLIGLALELSVFLTVNEIVRRPRPSVEKLGIVPSTFSFPSGHTAATIVLYGSIVLLVTVHMRSRIVKLVGWTFVLMITVAVGYARAYRGMHHFTDVAVGAVMGLGCLAVAVVATRASSLAALPMSTRAPRRSEVLDDAVRPSVAASVPESESNQEVPA